VTLAITATGDTTLYSESGDLANGAGQYLFAGTTAVPSTRRALVTFDVSSIVPPGSVVLSASVSMYCSRSSGAAAEIVSLHRILDTWGEGTSDAPQQEGAGAPATPGDATWIHRFHDTDLWGSAGGDFDGTPSASTLVGDPGASYSWTSTDLLADVQDWVDGSAAEYGWLVQGNESANATAKRFDSREQGVAELRPTLTIQYLPSGTTTSTTPTTTTTTIPPLVLEPFVDPLPRPAVATPETGSPGGAATYRLAIREVQQQLHRDLPPTTVWGFGDGPSGATYPGPTIEASRDAPVTVEWVNDLRDGGTGPLRTSHVLPVDTCLHGAHDQSPRTVVHLHGAHVQAIFDGYPEDTIVPGEEATYVYPNHQQAGTLWYHDHALGITRLNVYMGLAGYYLIRDPLEAALDLPAGEFEIPLAIQDRSFNPDGSLAYPATWQDHFFGDTILVNGKVWPYVDVTPGKYRFRILSGSTSRTYRLALSDGATFHVIGTDGGLLPAPVPVTSVTLASGERADVVVDFAAYAPGTTLRLVNDAPAPYPGEPGVGVIPDVMEFRVVTGAAHTAALPTSLVAVPPLAEGAASVTRDFELRKTSDPCTGQAWLINGLGWDDITERPQLGSTEIWRFVNRSGIMHPMHMHLVFFQVLDRQPFEVVGDVVTPIGAPVPVSPEEAGWKDTVQVGPSEIVRVIARFEDYKGRYPYHCHILEHEDHEMMRQFETVLCGDAEIDPAEECDDGNLATGDGCDAACLVEPGWSCSGAPSVCGFEPTLVPVTAKKLVALDKRVAVGKAKVVFVAKDPAIAKGTATDPLTIAAAMDVAWDGAHGAFSMPAGPTWLVNKDAVAKYVDKNAPTTGAVKTGVVKPARLAKVVAKSLGDVPLDLSIPPTTPVSVSHLVVNDGVAIRHCTAFTDCLHKSIASDTGWKLVCRNGAPDPGCTAASP